MDFGSNGNVGIFEGVIQQAMDYIGQMEPVGGDPVRNGLEPQFQGSVFIQKAQFFRLRYFRTSGAPERLYGAGRTGASYRDQDLTPARCFRRSAPGASEGGGR